MRREKGITKLKLIIIIFVIFVVVYGVFVVSQKNKKEENVMKEENKVVYIEQDFNKHYEYNQNIAEIDIDKNEVQTELDTPDVIEEGDYILLEDDDIDNTTQEELDNNLTQKSINEIKDILRK